MNLLSIMLYAADVLGNLAVFLVLSGIFFAIMFIISAFVSAMNNKDKGSYSSTRDQYDPKYTGSKSWIKRLWIPIVFLLMASIIPAQNTVYMIAASEIAEEGYKSEVGQKLTNIVNEKLDEYLTELSEKPVSERIKQIDLSKASSAEVEYLEKKIGELKK